MNHNFSQYLAIGVVVNRMSVFEADKFREDINDGWSQPVNQLDINNSRTHMSNSERWILLK